MPVGPLVKPVLTSLAPQTNTQPHTHTDMYHIISRRDKATGERLYHVTDRPRHWQTRGWQIHSCIGTFSRRHAAALHIATFMVTC